MASPSSLQAQQCSNVSAHLAASGIAFGSFGHVPPEKMWPSPQKVLLEPMAAIAAAGTAASLAIGPWKLLSWQMPADPEFFSFES